MKYSYIFDVTNNTTLTFAIGPYIFPIKAYLTNNVYRTTFIISLSFHGKEDYNKALACMSLHKWQEDY